VVNINEGDHVIWRWVGSGHTVTNWSHPADSLSPNFDGTIFDSDPAHGPLGQSNGTQFTWKSDRTGHVPYVCVPHLPLMSGRIIVSPRTQPLTVPVSEFRITEVQFDTPGGYDRIEIANLGDAPGDLAAYRMSIDGFFFVIPGNIYSVPAGDRVILHLGETGVNIYPDIYVPGTTLDNAGSVSLYAPSTLFFQSAFTNPALMIDFVQWGAPAQPNETTANLAGYWTTGTSINGVAAGHSIEYCANATLDHGVARWAEIAIPNFGGNGDCATPTASDTWGRLKVLYR
jgi:hypothetical protein